MAARILAIAALLLVATASLLMPACNGGPQRRPSSGFRSTGTSSLAFPELRPDLVLLVTGGTNGLLEPCHCSGTMPGGQARRAGLIESYRRAFPALLVIDTGDAFVPGRAASLRNLYVLRGLERMGYDALVLGDQEWAVPGSMIEELLSAADLAYLSTTVTSRTHPDLPLVEVVTRRVGSVDVAILSDIHDHDFRFLPESKRGELQIASHKEVANRAAALKKQGYLVIVACHGDDLQLAETAGICDADLFLRGNTLQSSPTLLTVEGKPVVKVGGDTSVGVVALSVDQGRIAHLAYRLETVDEGWPVDPTLKELYEEYMADAMPEALRSPKRNDLDFVSPDTCGSCHAAAYSAWQGTRHAHAYDSLVRVGRTGDPDCVKCHVVGFGTSRGFSTIDETPALANVGCQVCHPIELEAHLSGELAPAPVPRDRCLSCHTKVTDPAFEFEARRALVRCNR